MFDTNGNEMTASDALVLLHEHTQYYIPVTDQWALDMAMEALALEVAKEKNKRKVSVVKPIKVRKESQK